MNLQYTEADAVHICGKFWDTQYIKAMITVGHDKLLYVWSSKYFYIINFPYLLNLHILKLDKYPKVWMIAVFISIYILVRILVVFRFIPLPIAPKSYFFA